MDIKDVKNTILPIIKKLVSNKDLVEKFKSNPTEAVRAVAGDMDLGGIDLNDDAVKGVVNIVKTKLGGDDGKLDISDLAGLLGGGDGKLDVGDLAGLLGGGDGKLDMGDVSGLLGKAKDLLGNKDD